MPRTADPMNRTVGHDTTSGYENVLPSLPCARYSAWSDVVGSCGTNGRRISTVFPSEEKGLAHQRTVNAQVRDLGLNLWRCVPLTRTRRKLLTCGVATPWLSPAFVCPETERKASVEPARPPR
jgi:hypothetical protein